MMRTIVFSCINWTGEQFDQRILEIPEDVSNDKIVKICIHWAAGVLDAVSHKTPVVDIYITGKDIDVEMLGVRADTCEKAKCH